MSSATSVEAPADPELISAVRGGDLDAYGVLFERHADAARRLARQLVPPADADDLVSEAFVKVLGVLQRGGGPDVAFRAYLLTSVRRLQVDRFRAGARLHTTDDMEAFDPGVPFRDTAVEGFESEAAARAFASLPERWQLVLWHTEVEGDKPADIAPLLGMSANSVSALAYRAREGLRQAFLTQHVTELEQDSCRWTHGQLGAHVRGSISRRDGAKVEAHLDECRACMAIYLELAEVNSNLGAILAPLLLGAVATAYLGTAAASGTATLSLGFLAGRARDLVVGHSGVAAVAGVAASAVVVAGGVALGIGGPDKAPADAGVMHPTISSSASASTSADPDPSTASSRRTTGGADGTKEIVLTPGSTEAEPTTSDPSDPTVATDSPTGSPTETSPTDAPTSSAPTPSASPSSDPTSTPTSHPTPSPTSSPTSTPSPTKDPSPTRSPSPSPTPTPTTTTSDVSLAGSMSGARPTYTVVLRVAGLLPGSNAVLTLEALGGQVVRTDDPRCSYSRVTATCQLTASDSSPVSFEVVAPQGAELTGGLSSASDSTPGDNGWRASIPAP